MILCTHISDTLLANKFDKVKMYSHDEFFAKISLHECVCYVMFDKCVDVNNILENVFKILSMKSLNTPYSCKFTFNLIGHPTASKFYVCAICITCDKLAGLQINRLCNRSCEPYFSEFEMKRLFTIFYIEQRMLFPFSDVLSKESNLVQTHSIHSREFFSSSSRTIEFDRYYL